MRLDQLFAAITNRGQAHEAHDDLGALDESEVGKREEVRRLDENWSEGRGVEIIQAQPGTIEEEYLGYRLDE